MEQDVQDEVQSEANAALAAKLSADSERKMQMICQSADEQKARDIVVLDVQGQTLVADYFVMCAGSSTTHIHSIAEGVRDRLRENAHLRARLEGDAASFWVILDYGDVILHVFDEQTREFYDLESLWAEAKRINWSEQFSVGESDAATDAH